jgi:hypothetical protein
MESYDKFLPIGTVVMLKGGKKRAMITGFCSIADDNKEKMYDYSGCIYPEGYLSSNQVCLFDHSQIEKVYYLGLIDDEEKLFKAKLNDFTKHIGNSSDSVKSTEKPVEETENKPASEINAFKVETLLNDVSENNDTSYIEE